MNCIVTAGPTFEPLDNVRRLTNFSTGRLGTELAHFLTAHGHDVTLLIGAQATYAGARQVTRVEVFTTTSDLLEKLRVCAGPDVGAVFHAAAVSDFAFGKVWERSAKGDLSEVRSGKISTRAGTLLAELLPTPKVIFSLRDFFPGARLVGWKFEVDGDRATVRRAAERQIAENRTDACVANGPAYGPGFGLVTSARCVHVQDDAELFPALAEFMQK